MNDSAPSHSTAADLEALLAAQGGSGFLRRWRMPLIVALIALLAAAYFLFGGNGDSGRPQYRTAEATTGTLVVRVSATGKLEPTNQVDVGSEMSGTVETVFVDDDDRVTKGQVLAVLDLSKFDDAVARSRAAVGVAEAGVQQAQALVPGAKADPGFAQEYPRQGLFRYPQLLAPLSQADTVLGILVQLLAGGLKPGIARPG